MTAEEQTLLNALKAKLGAELGQVAYDKIMELKTKK